jgi:replicative DNA helicase
MRDSKNIERESERNLHRIRLASGRFIDCTSNHPILTDKGWVEAQKLTKDHSIACARKIVPPKSTRHIKEARWIGWMLGNGSMIGYRSPSFICSDIILAEEFIKKTKELFKTIPRTHPHRCKKVYQYDITYGRARTSLGNPCKNWLMQNDLWDRRSYEKIIPEWFFEQADIFSVAELLGGLIDTDGSIPINKKNSRGYVKYSTTSKIMGYQVLWLMSRLGIFARINQGEMNEKAKHPCYSVLIQEGLEIDRFRKIVKLTGKKQEKLLSLKTSKKGSNFGDRLGKWVGGELVKFSKENGINQESLGYRDQNKRISQRDLKYFLKKIGKPNKKLDWLVNSNIFWDRLKSIKHIGQGKVFDREVKDNHNFVANGIIVHNSIEQDSDVVSFLYRHDYGKHNQQDNKSSKTDLIIAKQRNGPVGKIGLVFNKAFTRFEEMAPEWVGTSQDRGEWQDENY